MSPSLKKYLFLSLFAFTIAVPKHFAQELPHHISRSVIFLNADTPLLYHASFKVFKYKFTGLIVFKNISEEEGTRIVFLSEAGLSIAEFSMKNNKIECLKAMPMVDRRSAKNYFARIIRMVLTPADCKKTKLEQNTQNTIQICKGKNGKHYYIYTAENLKEIRFKKGLSRKSIGFCENGVKTEKVLIQKRKKVLVEMKIVENAIK